VHRLLPLVLLVMACGHDHGPPHVRKMDRPDGSPALRGGGAPRSPRIANYKIDVHLDAVRHQLAGTETLTWTNTGASPVDKLPFHLYLNAFKNESSLFMRTSRGEMRGAKASDTAWGWINVDSLMIGGVEQAPKLKIVAPPDETVAELPLAAPIAPGQQVDINFKFTAQLPEVFARTGYKGEFNMVGQWFPKIGVRTGPPGLEQWQCAALSAFTEFFADFGVYDVTITVPSTYTVAATGVLTQAQESPGGTRTFTYHAEDVHDFAWAADPYFNTRSQDVTVDGGPPVHVKVYFRNEQLDFALRHLQAGVGAIEKFSADFTPYPWSQMTIIDPPMDAAAGAGGMEYPTLVTTEGDSVFVRPGMKFPEYVTVHEVGHNWFQGILASNEPEEAWMDEGVNEWADAHVMADLYGARTNGIDQFGFQADIVALRNALLGDPSSLPQPIASAAYAFVDGEAYSFATYDYTMRALLTLEHEVGTAKFMAAMKTYAKTFAFKHPTGSDLFATLSHELGEDLGWFFGPTFQQAGGAHLEIRSSSCRQAHEIRGYITDGASKKTRTETEAPDTGTWVCEVVVQNTGPVHVPVDVELRFTDGSTQRLHWDDKGAGTFERFSVEHSTKLASVRIDPDGIDMIDSPLQHAHRMDGEGAASLRAGARIGSWAQTLMQLVGP